jgi:hypothetical protein
MVPVQEDPARQRQALAPQDDAAHWLGRLVLHEGLATLLLDAPLEALGSIVVAADLRKRRACARLPNLLH